MCRKRSIREKFAPLSLQTKLIFRKSINDREEQKNKSDEFESALSLLSNSLLKEKASGILCEDLKNALANHQFVQPVCPALFSRISLLDMKHSLPDVVSSTVFPK